MEKQKKKKPQCSAKVNGQEYEPPYQFWHEKEFWADEHVSRGMTFTQRHFYRALLQAAFYSSTRPYLPTSDDDLWILADAGTIDNWIENKPAIMLKFQLTKVKGVEVWSHKRLMRDWIKLLAHSKKQSKRRKKSSSERDDLPLNSEPDSFEEDQAVECDESAV